MITVSKAQLSQVEYLLQQSKFGNHVLFEPDTIRKVLLSQPKPLSEQEAYAVEHHIEKLIALPDLSQQRAFLDQLPEAQLHRVIQTYFNIVENNLFETSQVRH
jgi:hypothetical protein